MKRRMDCVMHSGQRNEETRSLLDNKMKTLDYCQAGEGRHKCAYCAYELGFRDAVEATKRGINVLDKGSSSI